MGGSTAGREKNLSATDQEVSHVRNYVLRLILVVQLWRIKVCQNAGDVCSGGENKGTPDQSVSDLRKLNEERSCNLVLAADTAKEKEHIVVEGTEKAIELRKNVKRLS
jgi:hypothetical protein